MTTETADLTVLEYLREHRLGVLGTTNKDGTPQQTLIAYRLLGDDLAISTRRATLKAKNLSVRPNASLAIIDGRTQLIVHGKVKTLRDPEQVLSIHRELGLLADRQTDPGAFEKILRDEDRVVLLLTPASFFPTTMRR